MLYYQYCTSRHVSIRVVDSCSSRKKAQLKQLQLVKQYENLASTSLKLELGPEPTRHLHLAGLQASLRLSPDSPRSHLLRETFVRLVIRDSTVQTDCSANSIFARHSQLASVEVKAVEDTKTFTLSAAASLRETQSYQGALTPAIPSQATIAHSDTHQQVIAKKATIEWLPCEPFGTRMSKSLHSYARRLASFYYPMLPQFVSVLSFNMLHSKTSRKLDILAKFQPAPQAIRIPKDRPRQNTSLTINWPCWRRSGRKC